MKWYEDPIYIKMCEKAEKIQNLAPRETIDSKKYFEQHNFIVGVDGQVSPEDDGCYFGLTEEKQTWLPRQDQLQAMVLPESSLPLWLMQVRFMKWQEQVGEDKMPNYGAFYLMEQLWLAFVMKEKFKKTWDSEKEEWVE